MLAVTILWVLFSCISGLLFAYALKKAIVIWVNETKKKVVIMTMFCGIVVSILDVALGFVKDLNLYGVIGIFIMVYHVFLLVIKLNRLNVAYLMGHTKWAMILSISNMLVFLFQIYSGLACNSSMIHSIDSLLAWEFQARTINFIVVSGLLTFADLMLSVIVESSTCIFLRSTTLLRKKSVHWRDVGIFEVGVVLIGTLGFLFCIIGAFTGLIDVVFSLYGSIYFLFQSLLSCSIVTSIERIKNIALERRHGPLEQIVNDTELIRD